METPSNKKAPKEVTVKVLSVQQPHADLIISGLKWCENRTWVTNHRGILFIHASSWDAEERAAWKAEGVDPAIALGLGCRTGAIIGFVQLDYCLPLEELEAIEGGSVPEALEGLAAGLGDVSEESWDFVSGPYCWIMTNPKPLAEPIPAKGKLNIWKFTTEAHRLKTSAGPSFPPLQMDGNC